MSHFCLFSEFFCIFLQFSTLESCYIWFTISLGYLKVGGGVQGFFCMLGSYESAAPYGASAFYRLLISRSVLKICSVKVRPRPPK